MVAVVVTIALAWAVGFSSLLDTREVSVTGADPADAASIERIADEQVGRPLVRVDGDDLLTDSPMGEVRVRFARENAFGVLDHDVTLPDGTVVNNPLRVLAHPDGAEVLFTVRRLGASDADFDRDCATVLADLERLRSVTLAP